MSELKHLYPYRSSFVITPDDDVDIETGVTQGISMGTAGALKVTMANDGVVTIPLNALAAGVIHRIRVKRVWDTGTDADGLVAWYTHDIEQPEEPEIPE